MIRNKNATMRVLRVASIVTLLALALMLSSLFAPRPILIVLVMSIGQLLGTLAFALYIWVILADLRKAKVLFEPEEPPRDP